MAADSNLHPETRTDVQNLIKSWFVALATQPQCPDGSVPTLLTICSLVETNLIFPGVLEILNSIAKKRT